MDEAAPQKQQRIMITKSSIKRKPLADLTNTSSSSFLPSKKPGTSAASDSSIGSTQNPINVRRTVFVPPDRLFPSKPQRLKTDHLVGDGNQTAQARRHSSQNPMSKTKAVVQERRKNVKEGSVSLCSSTLNKIKDQGKVNQSCLNKTVNDGKKVYVAPRVSSTEKVKDKRKSIDVPLSDVPLSAHYMKIANNSTQAPITNATVKIKDKDKENVVRSGYSLAGNSNENMGVALPESQMKIKDKGKAVAVPLEHPSRQKLKNNIVEFGTVNLKDKDKENVVQSSYSLAGNSNENMGVALPESLMKIKDKGKAIAVAFDYPSRQKLKNNMMEFGVPFKGVHIKEREGVVMGSSSVNLAQKDKGKGVFTPINRHTSEKKDQPTSCPPILRTMSKRNGADAREDALQIKLQTEPPPNKKKRRCSTKEEYTLPQDYVEQQRAYFKEIDDFELQVEEV